MEIPATYVPIRTPSRKIDSTPIQDGFRMQDEAEKVPEIPGVEGLEFFKQEDSKYFGKLMEDRDDMEMSLDELKERKIMRLLLKIKNGTPPIRKVR